MSNIMCTLMCSYPGLTFTFIISSGVTLSSFSNYIRTFAIYFSIALVQKLVSIFLSISYASFTVVGTCIPNLCHGRQYLDFTLEIILSRRRKLSLIHHMKVYSSIISFAPVYLSCSTGLDCLK